MDLHIDKKIGALLVVTLLIGGIVGCAVGVMASGERYEHRGPGDMESAWQDNVGDEHGQSERGYDNEENVDKTQIPTTQQSVSSSSQTPQGEVKTDVATSAVQTTN